MSFVFPSWETAFSPEFYDSAKAMLEQALNKGNKPPVISGHIEVKELSMGTQPPTLTLLEIGDLSSDRFRGILRLGYQGDAWIEVRCRVQANPLSHNPNLASSTLPMSIPLLASQPLLVPMTIRLSKLHLRAILILVVSASKGITLVFKNDPLQHLDVSSTFDSVEVIRGYLQTEIEGQLREMFREDLPGIIHRLSQRWFTGNGVGGRVEMPYRDSTYDINPSSASNAGTIDNSDQSDTEADPFKEKPIFPPYQPPPSLSQLTPKRRALAQQAQRLRRASMNSESPSAYTTFPDIEDYDPTYGLRPEGVPTHSGYEAFGRLWEKSREGGRGLGSLMHQPIGEREGDVSDLEEEDDEEDEGNASVDEVEVMETLMPVKSRPGLSRKNTARSEMSVKSQGRPIRRAEEEWESFPAVGGGMITRPRVYHAQSLIKAPSEIGGPAPSPSATTGGGSVTARAASSVGGASSTVGSLQRVSPLTPRHRSASHYSPSPQQHASGGPGPSSLRRMVTSRSDVFLARNTNSPHRGGPMPSPLVGSTSYTSFSPLQRQNSSRRQSTVPSLTTTHSPSNLHSSRASPVMHRSPSLYQSSSSYTASQDRPSTYSTLPTSRFPSSSGIADTSPIKSPSKSHARSTSNQFGTSPPAPLMLGRNSVIGPGGITLPPLNNSVSQLAALSNSAHTLSPYARGHEHVAVRSFPNLGRNNTITNAPTGSTPGIGSNNRNSRGSSSTPSIGYSDPGMVKGRRKRIHRLNGNKKDEPPKYLAADIHSGDVHDFDDSYIRGDRSFDSTDKVSMGLSDLNISPSRSFESPYLPLNTHGGKPVKSQSLTGMAGRIMSDKYGYKKQVPPSAWNGDVKGSGRPNLMRSPDSRTSYGFPGS